MHVVINGKRYVEQTNNKNFSIGIGITTHNRNQLAADTYAKIAALTPDAKIVVVDDASKVPVNIDGDVYRFDSNVGIARAKNKCLELLADCDHIFLFDDDTYPIAANWWVPYVESNESHLMYCFKDWANGKPVGDDHIIYTDNKHVAHSHARGCMLYIKRRVLDVVGGMAVQFGKAMDEHGDWSNRIHNAGLTTFKHMDVIDSDLLIHSMDQHQEVSSSISQADRTDGIVRNHALLNERADSTEYAPYGKDVVIACYFANVMDPQRNQAWFANEKEIDKLKQSVESKGYEFVLIHNCFDAPNRVTISTTPYFERWLKEWQYLRDHPEIANVFVVDATDVDMVNNPFTHIKPNRLYVGDEPKLTINHQWMLTRHLEPSVNRYLRENGTKPLLNCGVVGGDRRIVMDLCKDMYEYHFERPQDLTEMGIFNKLLHTKYADRVEYGRHITSLFKKYEAVTDAWFRHK
jgi:glycosyltransferase involved in cell wall biosynthesis